MTRRVRLSPHDRKMQLLDSAGQIVLDLGLSKFTIDALAKEAGVSTSLIYKYFDTRIEILQALLARESERFATRLKERLAQSKDYTEVVRLFVKINFEDARAGSLLSMLYSQPDIRRGLDAAEFYWVSQVLVSRTAEEFGLSEPLARQIVPMGSAASRTAAENFSKASGKQANADKDQAIDDTVRFILGAFRAVSPDDSAG